MSTSTYVQNFLENYKPYKTYWNYEDGCILIGCIDLYNTTGEAVYRDFVLNYLQTYVSPNGDIPNYEMRQYNIDSINAGKALFFGYEQTGDERYKTAIEFHMKRLNEHPRCKISGNFWHKTLYPEQIWLDGLYMAQPFYMEYEMKFGGMAKVSDIVAQFENVRLVMYCEEKALSYHAYDEARVQPWADKESGCSPNFWLRSMGWYLMALVDCIGLMNEQLFEHYKALEALFKEAIRGILAYQDKDTGLFYQVIDHAENQDNYLETSGSAMIAYALLKGARIGALSHERYASAGIKAFESLVSEKLITNEEGETHLTDICWVAGLGPGEKRDGSVAYYLSEPKVSDDSKGVGPFMMAYAEWLMQKKTR
ncbi:MAG: glycosyl hydrolase family 88 [Clostridiales bacterium]|nr:glycosyl hydrolase family 88 [Clostridiales bacterium]